MDRSPQDEPLYERMTQRFSKSVYKANDRFDCIAGPAIHHSGALQGV